MNGVPRDLGFQSRISSDQVVWSISPTRTRMGSPLGFSQLWSSDNRGKSASCEIAVNTLRLSCSLRGILGTAQFVSVQLAHIERSSSNFGDFGASPTDGRTSVDSSGPQLVSFVVSPPTEIPMTKTPCDTPGKTR